MKYLMLIVSSLLLSACATPAPPATRYATPTEGDIAKLKVPMPSSTKFDFGGGWTALRMGIGELDESGCIDILSMNSILGDDRAKDGTIVVPANKNLLISVEYSGHNKICPVTAIVPFGKDKNYELHYRVYSGTCTLAIAERTIAGELVPTRLYEFEKSGERKACKVEGDIDKKLVSCSAAAVRSPFGAFWGTSCSSRPTQSERRIKCIPDVGCKYE